MLIPGKKKKGERRKQADDEPKDTIHRNRTM